MASEVNCDFSDLYNVLDLVSKDKKFHEFYREFCLNLRKWLVRKTKHSENYVYNCCSRNAKYCRMAQYVYWVVCVRNICSEDGIKTYFERCREEPYDNNIFERWVDYNRLYDIYKKVIPFNRPDYEDAMWGDSEFYDSDGEIIEYTDDDLYKMYDFCSSRNMPKYFLPPMNLKYYELKLFRSRMYSQPKTSEDELDLQYCFDCSEDCSDRFRNGSLLPWELDGEYESESSDSE